LIDAVGVCSVVLSDALQDQALSFFTRPLSLIDPSPSLYKVLISNIKALDSLLYDSLFRKLLSIHSSTSLERKNKFPLLQPAAGIVQG